MIKHLNPGIQFSKSLFMKSDMYRVNSNVTAQIVFGPIVDSIEPLCYSLWMIFPQKLLLSEHAHDRRIHPLCTGIPKWLCCTFFQTTQIESKRKNNPLCLMTLLSEQSYNPLAAKVRHPRQRTIRALGRSKNVKGGRGDTSFWCKGIV